MVRTDKRLLLNHLLSPGEANVVADVLSRKSGGSLAVLITQQPRLLKGLENMQIGV